MAQAIRTDNYLLSAEVHFGQNFHRKFDSFVQGLRKMAEVVDEKKVASSVYFNSPAFSVRLRTTGSSKKSILKVADLMEDAKFLIFDPGEGELLNQVRDSMTEISVNVARRYAQSVPVAVTGRLASAMADQDVVVAGNKSRIVGAFINWRQLDKSVSKRTRAKKKRGATTQLSKYPYQAPGGTLSIQGYWAFLDQGFFHVGAGRQIPAREFILNARGAYHSEDLEALNKIPKFLNDAIKEVASQSSRALRT